MDVEVAGREAVVSKRNGERREIKIMITITITIRRAGLLPKGVQPDAQFPMSPVGRKEICGYDEVLLHNPVSAFGPEH
jgi:hypothetical protein